MEKANRSSLKLPSRPLEEILERHNSLEALDDKLQKRHQTLSEIIDQDDRVMRTKGPQPWKQGAKELTGDIFEFARADQFNQQVSEAYHRKEILREWRLDLIGQREEIQQEIDELSRIVRMFGSAKRP